MVTRVSAPREAAHGRPSFSARGSSAWARIRKEIGSRWQKGLVRETDKPARPFPCLGGLGTRPSAGSARDPNSDSSELRDSAGCGVRLAAHRRHRHAEWQHQLRRLRRRPLRNDALPDSQDGRPRPTPPDGARGLRLDGRTLVLARAPGRRQPFCPLRCANRPQATAPRLRSGLAARPLPLPLKPAGAPLHQQRRPRTPAQPPATDSLLAPTQHPPITLRLQGTSLAASHRQAHTGAHRLRAPATRVDQTTNELVRDPRSACLTAHGSNTASARSRQVGCRSDEDSLTRAMRWATTRF